jgi:ribonuclease-3
LEAVLAAVYVESGLEAARAVCGRLLAGRFLPRDELAKADPKNRLQELLQEMGRPSPSYHLLEQSGPPHARKFVIEARVGDESLARGVASSKKEAARLAAEASLEVVVRRKGGGP